MPLKSMFLTFQFLNGLHVQIKHLGLVDNKPTARVITTSSRDATFNMHACAPNSNVRSGSATA